jgi:hypothetical protein
VGRPREREIELTEAERRELEGLARSASAPHGPVRRARIVLASADRRPNTEIARELGLSAPTVAHWRRRFLELGLAGLYDEHRPGRPGPAAARTTTEGAGPLAEVPRERPARAPAGPYALPRRPPAAPRRWRGTSGSWGRRPRGGPAPGRTNSGGRRRGTPSWRPGSSATASA